jgi:hypothetical protein
MTTSSSKKITPSGISKYWLKRERLRLAPSLPKSTRYGLRQSNHGPFLISDTCEMKEDSQLWTDDETQCQVFYDLEHAMLCSDRLADITKLDIEVVILAQ